MKKALPASKAFPIRGSSGIRARIGIPSPSAHLSMLPSSGNICEGWEQEGQMNSDMFTISPRMGSFTLRQKSISFLTSCHEISCGVVTRTAPSIGLQSWTRLRCSSLVPGGVSINMKSHRSQCTSRKNCFNIPVLRLPRQITASLASSRRNPIETTEMFSITPSSTVLSGFPVKTGDKPSWLECIFLSRTPSILGTEGPHKSTSKTPTSRSSSRAKTRANWVVTVLFPTPPLPLNTSILCLTPLKFSLICSMSKLIVSKRQWKS